MKKKTRSAVQSKVIKYLQSGGPATAAEIKQALNIKGNIYTMLQSMINRGDVIKSNRLYMTSQEGEVIDRIMNPKKYVNNNPYLEALKSEHDHIMQGIHQLQVAANYLNLRIKEFERGTSKT